MTERKRVETTYEKIRKKHPDIVDETNIKELALKTEQSRTLWVSVAYLWGSILCAILYLLLPDNDYSGALIGCSLLFFIVCSFEYFKTILNSSKIRYHYLGEHNTKHQRVLTYEQITKDKKLPSTINESSFKIVKATLYDKDDTDDSYVSWIYHKYNLYFKLDEKFSTVGFRVKRRVYLNAPLDAEYLLILSDSGKIISAYLSNAWKIDSQLFNRCEFSGYDHNTMPENNNSKEFTLKKNKLSLEILLFTLNALTYFLPMLFGIILLPFTTFFTTKFAIADKKLFSIINVILGYCSIILTFFILFL